MFYQNKNVLFLIYANSEFPVQLEVARKLRELPFIKVTFCFCMVTSNLYKEMRDCLDEGFAVVKLLDRNRSSNELSAFIKFRPLEKESKSKLTFKQALEAYKQRKTVILTFGNLLLNLKIDLIITSTIRLNFPVPYLIKAAKLKKKRIIFLPFGMETLNSYHIQLSNTARLNGYSDCTRWPFCLLFKNWTILLENNRRIFCAPLIELLIMKLLSAVPRLPTSPYGGNVDYVFTENAFMHRLYKDLVSKGVKLINTGTPYNDILYTTFMHRSVLYKDLCNKYEFKCERSLILVSLPQYIPAFWDSVKEYNSYADFLSTFFLHLSVIGKDYNIFVSIHPKMFKDRIEQFLTHFNNVRIVEEFIVSLIPLCEFYVCCESSTIRMAIASNKPVINYNFYGFDFNLFNAQYGVETVRSLENFLKVLISFCNKGDSYLSNLVRQRKVLERFGPLDGFSTNRIVESVVNILNLPFFIVVCFNIEVLFWHS